MKTKNMNPIFKIMMVFILCMGAKFSNAQTPNNAFGDNMIQVDVIAGQPVFAIYSGDINQDGNIDLLDYPFWDDDQSNFAFGYLPTDLNGDGNVDLLDYPFWDANQANFIYSQKPL